MQKDINKFKSAYDFKNTEANIYNKWLESGYFNPDNLNPDKILKEKDGTEKVFTCILPPPNVTGTLHTGHALMLAIQDTIIRYKRMQGYKTLWLPGTDHAAIATQSKVEKEIQKKENKNRFDLGREELLKRINEFVLDSQNTITSQFKSMGASLDWSRLAFTLDETRNKAVNTMFKKMYNDKLIYRDNKIVNWDPKGQTTISDDEIVYQEEKTKFYYFKYGPFVIGTARPETKFGDKYVVMHPDDERYKEYTHGQKIKLEWINGPIEATIIKDDSIDREFGTGVMTITPWHSVADFELAEKYNLDFEQIIDKYSKLLPIAKEFEGLKIKEAREKIVEKLFQKGLLVDKNGNQIEIDQIENYTHNVATAERTGGIIEPQIMKQWFIAVNQEFEHFGKKTTLKKLMLSAIQDNNTFDNFNGKITKKVTIMPDRFEKVYTHWIKNLRDWCISRQIWYGHRVPVWYDENNNIVDIGFLDDKYKNNPNIQQDEDTLDTWFSSGMWTFSTLGWPGHNNDFSKYHPTQFMETGHDILFFWVARMILMSTYALNQIPFETVYLHGLVRDGQGKKVSKSLGNALDPRELAEKYGTDALRMSMLVGNGAGNDLKLGEDKIKAYKNFANKIWNATRFVLEKTEDYNTQILDDGYNKTINIEKDNINKISDLKKYLESLSSDIKVQSDKDLILECEAKIGEINAEIDQYKLHLASEKIYNYFWHEFCDKHIELLKERIISADNNNNAEIILNKKSAQATALLILRQLIITLHPFMPFVTEEIWSTIKTENDDLLLLTKS